MRLLLSIALLGFLLCLSACSEQKVIMPTKTYDPPTMKDVATFGGASGGGDASDQAK